MDEDSERQRKTGVPSKCNREAIRSIQDAIVQDAVRKTGDPVAFPFPDGRCGVVSCVGRRVGCMNYDYGDSSEPHGNDKASRDDIERSSCIVRPQMRSCDRRAMRWRV